MAGLPVHSRSQAFNLTAEGLDSITAFIGQGLPKSTEMQSNLVP